MNKRSFMWEAIEAGKNPASEAVLLEAMQYYSDQICGAFCPYDDGDLPIIITVLETTANTLREQSKDAAELADQLKKEVGYSASVVTAKDEDVIRETHKSLYE